MQFSNTNINLTLWSWRNKQTKRWGHILYASSFKISIFEIELRENIQNKVKSTKLKYNFFIWIQILNRVNSFL